MASAHTETELADLVQLDDPQFFLNDPKPLYEQMHRDAPVLWLPQVNAFAVSKYEDVRYVSRSPEFFDSTRGIMLNDAKYGRNTAVDFFPPGGELVTTSDGPRQRELRRIIAPVFSVRAIAALEPALRRVTREAIDRIEPGQCIDFVETLAVPIPISGVATVMGIADIDVAEIRRWSDEVVKMGAAVKSSAELDAVRPGLVPMRDYVYEALIERRANPTGGSDLLSVLLNAEINNEKVTDLNILTMAIAILVAGNETTRNLVACMAWALGQHPEQMNRLHADRSLTAGAVEESLRWMSPVIAHTRCAVHDTELRGVPIDAGQYLHVLYAAANQDAEVFENPYAYDIGRLERSKQIAFGDGPHVCPGSSLARLEARILFEELFTRFSGWTIAGEPVRLPSIMHNGFRELPLVFHR